MLNIADRATLDPYELFSGVKDIWLEVGFGAGEHLLAIAKDHPEKGIVGCEFYPKGVSQLLGKLEQSVISNIRLYFGDATELIELLAPNTLSRIYLLYPDPWPKARHAKRRFINLKILDRLSVIMRSEGELRVATDMSCLAAHILAHINADDRFTWEASRAANWRNPWPGWQSTRYEKKALRAGRKPIYLTFRRI